MEVKKRKIRSIGVKNGLDFFQFYQSVKDNESDAIVEEGFSQHESSQRLFDIQILENGQNSDLTKVGINAIKSHSKKLIVK